MPPQFSLQKPCDLLLLAALSEFGVAHYSVTLTALCNSVSGEENYCKI